MRPDASWLADREMLEEWIRGVKLEKRENELVQYKKDEKKRGEDIFEKSNKRRMKWRRGTVTIFLMKAFWVIKPIRRFAYWFGMKIMASLAHCTLACD